MSDSFELAATPGLGRVYDCGSCNCVHLQVGPCSIVFSRDAYFQLVEMVNRSAANFELMLERRAGRNEADIRAPQGPVGEDAGH